MRAKSRPRHWRWLPEREGPMGDPPTMLGQEAGGIKALRVGPELGVPMGHVRDHDHEVSLRHSVATDHVVRGRHPRDRPQRGTQTQGLLYDGSGVAESRQVARRRRPMAEHIEYLVGEVTPHDRMPAEQIECPRQRGGGGLEAGEQEGHHLVV